MTTRILVGLALLGLGCGTPNDGVDIGSSEEPIIGGTTDNGDPAVMAIFTHAPGSDSGFLCTGTVISPTKLLTAAHCVDPRTVGEGMVFEVLSGTTLGPGSPRVPVTDTTFDPAFDPDNITAGHDVGIVTLAFPTTITPVRFATAPFSVPKNNKNLRIVGYGSNTHSNTGSGTKRTATARVNDYDSLVIHIGTTSKQTCHGDSGGPAFQSGNGVETIVGITSYGYDFGTFNVCIGGGYSTNVATYADFITANL